MRAILDVDKENKGFVEIEEVEKALKQLYPGNLFENGFKNVDFKNIINQFTVSQDLVTVDIENCKIVESGVPKTIMVDYKKLREFIQTGLTK